MLTSLYLLTRALFFYTYTVLDIGCAFTSTRHHSTDIGTMVIYNYTAADDQSSGQTDSRLSLGSPLSQVDDIEDTPFREHNSGRIIYAIDDSTLNDLDQSQQQQQRLEQDVHDLSMEHHSTVGGSDRVLRSMSRHSSMKRSASTSSNHEEEQQYHDRTQRRTESLPSRSSSRLAFRRQSTMDGVNHSTSSSSSTSHEDQEQRRQGLQALTRIEYQFANLRNR